MKPSRLLADDIHLAYTCVNPDQSGTPLLLIMGYACTMDMWPTRVIEALSQKAPLIVFDNRGMGFSEAGDPARFSIPQFARDTIALLDGLGLKQVNVLGWSMGSMIALECALMAPERFGKLFLYSCYSSNAPLKENPEIFRKLTDLSGSLEERIARMFANLFPPAWRDGNPNPARHFPPTSEPIRDVNIRLQARALEAWPGVTEKLSSVRQPVCIVTGSEDIIIPPRYAVALSRNLPQVRVVEIPGMGHGLMYQDPESLVQAVFSDL
jgi:pimeloyl-ACP methyl ester carboxylesterase